MQFSPVQWQGQHPRSSQFDDVYFSTESGPDETEYVFIQQNCLPERFRVHQSPIFHIIETGFGTGLNFFCAAAHWLQCSHLSQSLLFTSIEKYPILPNDLKKLTAHWPQFSALAGELITCYDSLNSGRNEWDLMNGRIKLTLWIGDISDILPQLYEPADAWFLDGFSPAKNPEMWSTHLFQNMARLSYPGTTFATFTSAGHVRRGLQAAGFDVQRHPGFGKKREMLRGTFLGLPT